jgi:hypothetical protein
LISSDADKSQTRNYRLDRRLLSSRKTHIPSVFSGALDILRCLRHWKRLQGVAVNAGISEGEHVASR